LYKVFHSCKLGFLDSHCDIMSGLLGLVDYHSDEGSSVSSSPLQKRTSSTLIQTNDSFKIEIKDSNVNESKTGLVSSLITNRTTDYKLPSNLVQPKSFESEQASSEAPLDNKESMNNDRKLSPEPESLPVPSSSRLTIEQIRLKRNALLVPEPYTDCPTWTMPPEPTGEIDPEIQAKVEGFHTALQTQGISFNSRLQANRGFRNPHIYYKLVEFLGLDELGTNFERDWFDPAGFPPEAYAAKLRDAQNKAASAATQSSRSAINFVPPHNSSVNPSEIASSAIKRVMTSIETSVSPNNEGHASRRRKTKWDLRSED